MVKKVKCASNCDAEVASGVGGVECGGIYLAVCFWSPMSRNSVSDEKRVKSFAVIQEDIC